MSRRSEHKLFEKTRVSGWTVRVSSDFGKASVDSLCPDFEQIDGVRGPFDEVPASEFARVLKCSVGFGGRCQNLYLKQFFFRSAWDFVKHLFRPSRAERAFCGSLMLAEEGFCVPQIAAVVERRYGPLCMSSFLITCGLEGAEDLYACFDDNRQGSLADLFGTRRRLVRSLGETVGRMHGAGIFHGDLRAGNIFVKRVGRAWQFFFLDNERTRMFRELPSRLRLKNLVQLNMLQREAITQTDRMRFFEAYLAQNADFRGRWKELARKVFVKTGRRLGHRLG